ncbi:MAG TPA: protein kinase, partial [Candidatus Krumholzibacteria bacterium]|nr:protein kinase [Candidatus Krumholzibacteria bacterium]
MGEVYRARDTRLGRDVAIKVLPEDVAKDPERLARFEREAKVLASLNHPNIAALYGLEETGGRVFLVMELAEGEDLSQRLKAGPVSVEEAMKLGRQIGEGLRAAHAKGIVHRDLKPANIMLSENGTVKLLDFGLARAYQADDSSGDPSNSPTITAAMTQHGVILGTAAYMSPEQARGKSVDRQTDIWAFGVVMFEMLTGHRLFDGETVSDSVGAILHRDPDWELLPPATPRPLRRLLRRCLVRERAMRLHDIGDALIELGENDTDGGVAAPAPPPARRASLVPWVVAIVAVVVAAGMFFLRGDRSAPLPLRKLTVLPVTDRDGARLAAPSPDGKRIAYLSHDAVWIRELDQLTPRRVSDARGWGSWVCIWSPDSRSLAFTNDNALWRTSIDSSAPTKICDIPADDRFICGAWDAQDRIILGKWRGGLLEVSAKGGTIRELMKAPDELVDYHDLSLLPDGKTLLASAHLTGDSSGVDIVRDGKILHRLDLSKTSFGSVAYSGTGHIIFEGDPQGVWAVPFSLKTFEKTGDPFVIDADGSLSSAARDGSLIYARNVQRNPTQLVRVDRSGKVMGNMGDPGDGIRQPLLSPAGSLLAYSATDKGIDRLWMLDLESARARRVTLSDDTEEPWSWSPDGTRLLMSRWKANDWSFPENGLYLVDIAHGGTPERVGEGRSGQILPAGRGLLYWKFGVRNDDRLMWRTLDKDAKPNPFLPSVHAVEPALSPDGRVVAFVSDDSGVEEIWLARFPGGEGLMQLTQGGGGMGQFAWSRDSKSLYFTAHGALYQVQVTEGTQIRYGTPKQLFDGTPEQLSSSAGFDVLPDGSGFVMVQQLPLKDAAIVYVQNWLSEFQKRP